MSAMLWGFSQTANCETSSMNLLITDYRLAACMSQSILTVIEFRNCSKVTNLKWLKIKIVHRFSFFPLSSSLVPQQDKCSIWNNQPLFSGDGSFDLHFECNSDLTCLQGRLGGSIMWNVANSFVVLVHALCNVILANTWTSLATSYTHVCLLSAKKFPKVYLHAVCMWSYSASQYIPIQCCPCICSYAFKPTNAKY